MMRRLSMTRSCAFSLELNRLEWTDAYRSLSLPKTLTERERRHFVWQFHGSR